MKRFAGLYENMKWIMGLHWLLLVVACQPEAENEGGWVRIGPGGGGSTFIPTFAYDDPGTFLIRCDMTGAYLTHNEGESFAQISYANGSNSFAFDPLDPAIIYIGADRLNRSTDHGKTWECIFPDESEIIREVAKGDHAGYSLETSEESLYSKISGSKQIKNIVADPSHPGSLYFSMGEFLVSSSDGGATWSLLDLGRKIDYLYTNTSGLNEELLAFAADGFYRIRKSTSDTLFTAYPGQMVPAFSFTGGMLKDGSGCLLYALNNNANQSMRYQGEPDATTVWVSSDQGLSWKQVRHGMVTNEAGHKPTYSMMTTSEHDAATVYLVTSNYPEIGASDQVHYWYGILKSQDGTENWDWVLKAGGGSGQYGVRDGVDAANVEDAWVQKAFGGEYIRYMDIGVAPGSGEIAIATDWYRSLITRDGGQTWEALYSKEQADGTYTSTGLDVTTAYGVHVDPFNPEHIAISYTDIGFHHSYNGGKSWTRSTEGISPEWHNTCYWMVFDPDVKDKLWSVWSGLHDFPRGKMTRNPAWTSYGRGGVAVSTDGGNSWVPQLEGIGFDSPSTSIVLDPDSPPGNRTLYVSVYGKGVFKSTDDGRSWELRNKGIEGSKAAFELTLLPDGTLYLVTSPVPMHLNGEPGREYDLGKVYRSSDQAASWQALDPGPNVGFPNGLAFDPHQPGRIYLASWGDITLGDLVSGATARATGGDASLDLDGGILRSDDYGDTWTRILDEDMYVYDVTCDPDHPGRIYCNTFNRSALRSDDSGEYWARLKGYDFHWGHRVIMDPVDREKVYLTTFGSSVWHGEPVTENEIINSNIPAENE